MAKVIMVQGTMSNAGKSFIVAGLCRVFRQDGYRAAPFKSQNMALNSFITKDGLEMGRAQAMQAEAAGMEPSIYMNPILLKPTNNIGSQVIVNGEVVGNMRAKDYFEYKKTLIPDIKRAFLELSRQADIIVIEGAGSPAEINLKENDIVNMGLAELVDAPVLLVGDIDRGGVFAQLLGTLMLLTDAEKARVKGLIINKFRGDKTILDPGIIMLEEKGKVPVAGVVPYMQLQIEDEDSLSERLVNKDVAVVDLAVIRFPRISNFTDMDVFEQIPEVSVRYVSSVREIGAPDFVILPGSKNTMEDLEWMRQSGLEAVVKKLAARKVPVFGICGGFQMLGMEIADPAGVEAGGSIRGMELLPVWTVLQEEKTRQQVSGYFGQMSGPLEGLSGKAFRGYEIHMGLTRIREMPVRQCGLDKAMPYEHTNEQHVALRKEEESAVIGAECREACDGNIYGSYVHGIFDYGDIAVSLVQILAKQKGINLSELSGHNYAAFKESQYDLLADGLREHMDMKYVYEILRESQL